MIPVALFPLGKEIVDDRGDSRVLTLRRGAPYDAPE